MDDFKKGLSESVQIRLSLGLSLTILITAVFAGIFSFVSAFKEAHELQDDVLRQIAALVDRQRISPDAFARLKEDSDVSDEDSRVMVHRIGSMIDGKRLSLPPTLADGLHTLEINGKAFRVLAKTTTSGERIAAAQAISFRDEIARDSALHTVLPLLILVPILLLVVAYLVRTMFRPIADLSREIEERVEQDLHSVREDRLPSEVRPFAVAINRLLARVAKSMDTQRRFLADAAHELRTPLAALSLQAERLSAAEMSGAARERLGALSQGIERSRNLLDQLLTFAKAQSPIESPKAPISVQKIFRRVLEDLMPIAEAKGVDVGVLGDEDAQVWVTELDMIVMLKNLVDNAIRYTAAGGRVDLSVNTIEDRAEFHVQDTGPGIPRSERERVFDPFYRTLGSGQMGSGLGLSIVKAIADRIGADVRLSFSDEAHQCGLHVSVVVPVAPPTSRA